MDGRDLLNNIKEKSNHGLKDLTDEDLDRLLNATANAIDNILEKGDSVEIDDFGTFSRRKQDAVSVSVFVPAERLNDRINRRR